MNQILDAIRVNAIKESVLNAKQGDIQDVYRAIGTTLSLANTARNEGLLAMEDVLLATDDSLPGNNFFKKIGTLIIDGTDPDYVEEIATNMYWRKRATLLGDDAFVAYIYIRGMLMIQRGEPIRIIEDVLLSLLSDEEMAAYNVSKYKWTEEEVSYKTYRVEFKDETTQTLVDYVNESFETMTDEQFKQLLNTAHNECMITVLPYLTDKAEVRLFDNVSERLKTMYIEDAKFQQYVNEKSLREVLLQLVGYIIVAKKIKD